MGLPLIRAILTIVYSLPTPLMAAWLDDNDISHDYATVDVPAPLLLPVSE
jgi:hypothetical protein